MTKTTSDKIRDYKQTIEKNDGKSYFDSIQEEISKDPEGFNKRLESAKTFGKSAAQKYLDVVRDHTHKDHEKTYAEYKDKYQGNPDNVVKKFTQDAMDACGAKNYEVRNHAYEQNTLSNRMVNEAGKSMRVPIRINNDDDGAIMSKYKDLMTSKWGAVGYDGDEAVISDFWKDHTLSAPQGNLIN